MFADINTFAENQLKCMLNEWKWTGDIYPADIREGLKNAGSDAGWANIRHNISHLLNLGILDNEVLISYYKGYCGVTNYRFFYNDDKGLISIPLSKLLVYAGYQPGDPEKIEEAKKINSNSIFKLGTIVYIDIAGNIQQLYGTVLNEDVIKKVMSQGEYLELNDTQVESIYKSRNVLSRSKDDVDDLSFDDFLNALEEIEKRNQSKYTTKNDTIDKNQEKSSTTYSLKDNSFLHFIIESIIHQIDKSNDNYSQLVFAFKKMEDYEFDLAKKSFDDVLVNDIENEYANYGIDVLKCFKISAGEINTNDDLIEKYEGSKKEVLEILNSHLKIEIAKDLIVAGISNAAKKREAIQAAEQKAAAAVMTATTASNFKSKKVRNLGYAASAGMLASSGSSRADAKNIENKEVQLIEAGVGLVMLTVEHLKSNNSDLAKKYVEDYFKKIATKIVFEYHQLIKTEFRENSSWGWTSKYEGKINSKMLVHTLNFYKTLDYLGFDNHRSYVEKEYFDNYFDLLSELSDQLKNKDTLSGVLNLLAFLWVPVGFIWVIAADGPVGLAFSQIGISLLLIGLVIPPLTKHKKHKELKELFNKAKASILGLKFDSSDVDFEKIGID